MSGPGVSVDEWALSRGLLGVSKPVLMRSISTCGTTGLEVFRFAPQQSASLLLLWLIKNLQRKKLWYSDDS